MGINSHEPKDCPEKCKICGDWHKTSRHTCHMCGFIGIKSHCFDECPDRCKICNLPHTISEHNSWFGEG